MHSRWPVIVLSLVAALYLPARAAAQLAGAGTGSIVGLVKDATGASVQNVEITITGRTLGRPRTTTSAPDGEYRFVQLPPGDFVLTFAFPGFERQQREAHVGLAATLTLDVTLTITPSQESVVVLGTLDRQSTTISQSFNARQLESLPSSRSLAGLFALTQGMAMPAFEVGGGLGLASGAVNAYGRNNSPRHTLEGIVVTGLFGAGFSPDYGALEEVSVLTAAHGAEWATAGVHTDIVTKSGSNQYRGAFYGAVQDRRVQSTNIDAVQIQRGALGGGGLSPTQVNQLWRYADANADAGGFLRKDSLWWYASVRRQEVATRLVNFEVEPYITRLTNYSGKATARLSNQHSFVLYAQRGLNHQPYRLDPFGGGSLSAATVINRSTDSTVDQRNSSRLWKAEWNAVLSNSLLFEVRAGQWATNFDWVPRNSEQPRFEDFTTSEVRGGNRAWSSTQRRDQILGTASYFTKNRTGRHYFRFGGDAIRFLVRDTWLSGYPGSVLHVLRQGRTTSVYFFDTPALSEGGVWTWSSYASDAWQMNRRLTVTAGIRLDGSRLFLPAQNPPATRPEVSPFAAVPNLKDWKVVSPRAAAAFDVNGDGMTLAKLSYGRYRGAPNASLAFNSNPNASPWYREYSWTDSNQSGSWDPSDETHFVESRGGGTTLESIDPDVKLTVLDELGAWIERVVSGGAVIRSGLIWRLERSYSARQNLYQRYDDFTVPVAILDRGPDGVAGTPDDGATLTAYDLDVSLIGLQDNELRNVPGSSSEYLTWEVGATREARGRWTFGGGFTHTWNGDQASSYAGQAVRSNTHPVTPNDFINTGKSGRHEFTTWTAKAYGTFRGPWNIRSTPIVRHQSGQPFGRTQATDTRQLQYRSSITLLMEPVGSRRMDNITLVDLRLERTTEATWGRVSAFFDVFNLLNANPEQNIIWASGSSFLKPVTIVPPRIARVGIAFDW